MKIIRTISIISVLSLLLTACSEIDGPGTSRPPGWESLSECVVQSVAKTGGEVIVQWNGFPANPVLHLATSDGQVIYPVEIEYITSSGLVFYVPSGLEEGMYRLVLETSGPRELGTIYIEPSDMPVIGIKVPDYSVVGETLVISGIGMDSSFGVAVEDENGIRKDFPAVYSSTSLSVLIPEDQPGGEYRLYLTKGGDSWLISERFAIAKRKRMIRLGVVEPYFKPTYVTAEWRLNYSGDELTGLTLAKGEMTGGEYDWTREEVYERVDEYAFSVQGGQDSCSTNNVEFEYIFENGRIVRADVLRWGSEAFRPYTWHYNPDSTLEGLTFDYKGSTRYDFWYEYENGNIVEAYTVPFVYDGTSLQNHLLAPDFIACFCAINAYSNEPYRFFPALLGWLESPSRTLPSYVGIQSGPSYQNVPLEYEFDADGYITKATIKGEDTFIYFEYSE